MMEETTMHKLCSTLIALLSALLLFTIPTTVNATSMLGIHKVMSFRDNIGMPEDCSGDLNGTVFTLNGERLKLRTELGYIHYHNGRHIGGGYVRLMSADESNDYLSFPIAKMESFVAHKITTDTGAEFLTISTRINAVSDSALKRFWLVGKYGNQYISFASEDSLKQAGLLYQDIDVDVLGGEIKIAGYAAYHSRDFYPNGDNRLTYNGHKAIDDRGELYINQVRLFWNDSAQWFGIRLIDQ